MDLENTGMDWRDEAPLLAAMSKTDPFRVPNNYFSDLQENISSRCIVEKARFSNENEFTLPTGYFESLSSRIEERISEENMRMLVPADGFTVPKGYFNQLEQRILAKTGAAGQETKTLIRPIRSGWLKYAVAACVTVALGSVLTLNNQKKSFESQLGSLSDQEIISYLQVHSDMGDTPLIMENLSQNLNLTNISNDIPDAELEEFINTTL